MTLLDALALFETLSRGTLIVAILAVGTVVTGAVFAYIALRATSRAGRR